VALTVAVALAHAWLLGAWSPREHPVPQAHPPAASTATESARSVQVTVPATAPVDNHRTAPTPTQVSTPPPITAIAKKHKENMPLPLAEKAVTAINSETETPPPASAVQPEPDVAPVTDRPPPPLARAATASHDPTADATTTPPGPLRWPAPVALRYDVHATRKSLSLMAEGLLHWQPGPSSYRARLEVKALLFGQRSQTSVGTLDTTHGLQPTRYGDKNRTEQATHFDRTRTPPVLRFSANTPDQPLYEHTQDRLSVLFQIAAMLAGDPGRFRAGDTVALHTAGPRDADVWRFLVGRSAPLALPIGTLEALHLTREPLHAYDNRVELWLAPSLGYLPVRILWTQANGDVVDQQLSHHNPMEPIP